MPFNRFRTPTAGRSTRSPRPGDEVHRRGDGLRRRLRHRVRKSQAAAYGSAAPTEARRLRLHLDRQPRQADDDLPDQGAGRPRLRDPRHPGHRRGAAPQRGPLDRRCASTGGEDPHGEKTTVQMILDGEIDLIVNTPHGATGGGSSRVDGYEIPPGRGDGQRPASPRSGPGGGRAGHRGDPPAHRVRSLQEPVAEGDRASLDQVFDHVLTRTDPRACPPPGVPTRSGRGPVPPGPDPRHPPGRSRRSG